MTKDSLAALLDGRTCRNEVSSAEAREAKQAGLVVIFGASDDLIEFRGAIYDEQGTWRKAELVIYHDPKTKGWAAQPKDALDEIEDCYAEVAARESASRGNIVMASGPGDKGLRDCQWVIATELPHAKFTIRQSGELFCRGLVIDVADLK